MPTLVYWDSDGIERNFDIGPEPVLIGRASECAIRSDDTRVSRRHARIVSSNEGCWIEDLGSANGVYVGLKKVSQALIPAGEIVVVGSIILQLQPHEGQRVPPPSGTHTQLCVWLKIERESRAALIEERNALGQRLSQMHKELDRQAPGGPGASAGQLDQLRAELGAQREQALAQLRGELEAERRQAVDQAWLEAEAAKDREVQTLRAELAEVRAALESRGQVQEQARQLWDDLRGAKQRIVQLEQDAQARESQIAATEEARAKLQEHGRALRAELEQWRARDQDHGVNLVAAEARVRELEEEGMRLQAAAQAAVRSEEARRGLEARVAELSAEIERLREAEQGAWAHNDELAGEVERLRGAVRDARAQAAELASVREERDRLKFDIEVARAELAELRAAGADVQTQHAAELRAAQSRVERLTADVANLRAAAAVEEQATAARLAVLEEDKQRLTRNLDDANDTLYKLRGSLDRANAELEELRAWGHRSQEESAARSAAVERELSAARDRLAEAEQGRAAAERELSAARDRLAEAEQGRAAAERELSAARRAIEELSRKESELGALRDQNADLRAKLDAADRANAELNSELADVHHELATAEERLQEAEGVRQRLAAEAETLRAEVETRRRAADDLRGRSDQLSTELATIRAASERAQNAELAAARGRADRLTAEVETLRQEVERLREAAARPALPPRAREHILTLQDCVAGLRASMRAASDETAVMSGDSASVQVIVDALSDATEQIERVRDSLRELDRLLG